GRMRSRRAVRRSGFCVPLAHVEGLPAADGGRRHLLEFAFEEEWDHLVVAVGFVAGPGRLLPAWREDGEDDAAGFAAGFDSVVPVVAGIEVAAVEPDGEAAVGELAVDLLGE